MVGILAIHSFEMSSLTKKIKNKKKSKLKITMQDIVSPDESPNCPAVAGRGHEQHSPPPVPAVHLLLAEGEK